MKWLLSLFLMSVSSIAVAKPSLEVLLADSAGQQVSLAEYKGKVVYVDFWASWCGPCRKSFPWMEKMHKQYAKDGLAVVAINLDPDSQDARHFLEQIAAEGTDVGFALRYDPEGKVAGQFDLMGMPSSYVFNREGELVGQHTGFFRSKEGLYEQQLVELLKE